MLLSALSKMSIEEKNEILDRVEERASSYQYEYCGCGRCVVLALLEEFSIPYGDVALKAASFACLGIARTGNTCGALIGGIIALGLASGVGDDNIYDYFSGNPETTIYNINDTEHFEVLEDFYQKFEQEMGGINCRDIQGKLFGKSYNLLIPAQYKEFIELSRTKCPEKVGKVARLAAEAILNLPEFKKTI